MWQLSLLDVTTPAAPPSLPYQGTTPTSRRCSQAGASAAAITRARLQQRYLRLLAQAGASGRTDHEAADHLGCQVNSINSTRAALRGTVMASGVSRRGPYGVENTVWVLRRYTTTEGC